jgi:hypothetical protein
MKAGKAMSEEVEVTVIALSCSSRIITTLLHVASPFSCLIFLFVFLYMFLPFYFIFNFF